MFIFTFVQVSLFLFDLFLDFCLGAFRLCLHRVTVWIMCTVINFHINLALVSIWCGLCPCAVCSQTQASHENFHSSICPSMLFVGFLRRLVSFTHRWPFHNTHQIYSIRAILPSYLIDYCFGNVISFIFHACHLYFNSFHVKWLQLFSVMSGNLVIY